MKTDEIKLLYKYNYWADQRILATCAKVSQEQYIAATSYGNLRATVIHILDAEWSWRLGFQKYFQAEDPTLWNHTELTEADVPTLDSLQERWQPEERAMRAYVGSLSDQDLNGLVRYLIPGGILRERVLWHCLLHVVNHGTQHRSEAAALLTSYGQSPGGLDFTAFLNGHFNLPS
jgi:uncharacterized damage-inducible protein DinB